MGNKISNAWHEFWPDMEEPVPIKNMYPNPRAHPSFDPMLGFPNGRKEREVKVSRQEMIDSNVELKNRGYCAHKYMDFMRCYIETSYFERLTKSACAPAKHAWFDCEYEDVVLRHKEYEREKRLLARQKRRIAMGLEEDPNGQPEAM